MMSLGLAIDIICFGAVVVFFVLCLKDQAKKQNTQKEDMIAEAHNKKMSKAS
jgi:hypothetical protein